MKPVATASTLRGFLLSIASMLCISAVYAETYSTAELRRCVDLEDDAARLACFDELAGDRLASDSSEDDGARRYTTRIEGREDRRHYRDSTRNAVDSIRIVAFVHEYRRGRGWRRYMSDDGRYWRLPEGETDGARELPFDAEVIPDPKTDGGYLLRPSEGGEPVRIVPETDAATPGRD